MADADGLEELDPFGAEMRRDPCPYYRRMHAQGVVWSRRPGAWVVGRHHDAVSLMTHPHVTHWSRGGGQQGPAEIFQKVVSLWMELLDPRGGRLRGLVAPAFSAPAVRRLRAPLGALADRLMGEAMAAGRLDAIGGFAEPIALAAMARMLGVPEDRDEDFGKAARATIGGLWQTVQDVLTVPLDRATEAVVALRDLLAEAADAPPNSLLGVLGARMGAGEIEERLALAFLALFLFAGLDNMVNFIGNAAHLLAEAPDQLALLRRDPGLLPAAVAETLRLASPVQVVSLAVAADLRLGNRAMARGDTVLVCVGAANRDPNRYRDPDRLDVARTDGGHISFGLGPLACMGQALARLQGEVAIGALARYAGHLAVEPPLRLRSGPPALRGFEALSLRLEGCGHDG
jgi:cytochrome P450